MTVLVRILGSCLLLVPICGCGGNDYKIFIQNDSGVHLRNVTFTSNGNSFDLVVIGKGTDKGLMNANTVFGTKVPDSATISFTPDSGERIENKDVQFSMSSKKTHSLRVIIDSTFEAKAEFE